MTDEQKMMPCPVEITDDDVTIALNAWSDTPLEWLNRNAMRSAIEAVVSAWNKRVQPDGGEVKRLETASEHIARDMREGRFPQRSEPAIYEAPRDISQPLKVRGVGRVGDEPRALLVLLNERPADDELRSIYDFLHGWRSSVRPPANELANQVFAELGEPDYKLDRWSQSAGPWHYWSRESIESAIARALSSDTGGAAATQGGAYERGVNDMREACAKVVADEIAMWAADNDDHEVAILRPVEETIRSLKP